MQLISNPKLFIVFSIVVDGLKDVLSFKFIYNFNFIKIDHISILSSTRNVSNHIGLYANLHFDEFLIKGNSEVISRVGEFFLQDSQSFIDSHIALLDLMEARKHGDNIENDDNNDDLNDTHTIS